MLENLRRDYLCRSRRSPRSGALSLHSRSCSCTSVPLRRSRWSAGSACVSSPGRWGRPPWHQWLEDTSIQWLFCLLIALTLTTILDNPPRVYTPQLILMLCTVELNNKNPADVFGRLSTDQWGATSAAFAYELAESLRTVRKQFEQVTSAAKGTEVDLSRLV